MRDINENNRLNSISGFDSSRGIAETAASDLKKVGTNEVNASYSKNSKKFSRNRNGLTSLGMGASLLSVARQMQPQRALNSPLSTTDTSSSTQDETSSVSVVSASITEDAMWKKGTFGPLSNHSHFILEANLFLIWIL